MTFAGKNNGLKEIRHQAGHGREKGAVMPRRKRERREKAGKVSSGGACEGKRGWDAPPGAEKKRKSVKSGGGRGKEEKNRLRCPAGSGKEEKKREK